MQAKKATISSTTDLNKPVFCISAINLVESIKSFEYPKFESEIKMDSRMISDFTDSNDAYVLVIQQPEEFLSRVKSRLSQLDLGYRYDLVKYRDTSCLHENGDQVDVNDAFHKEEKFAYQREFRIQIETEIEDYYKLCIGDISDISEIIPAEPFITGLRIEAIAGEPIEEVLS